MVAFDALRLIVHGIATDAKLTDCSMQKTQSFTARCTGLSAISIRMRNSLWYLQIKS